MGPLMDDWIHDDVLWIRRTAVIHQVSLYVHEAAGSFSCFILCVKCAVRVYPLTYTCPPTPSSPPPTYTHRTHKHALTHLPTSLAHPNPFDQLRFGTDTDASRLLRYCELRMHEEDFFMRKAIGWALRTFARHSPAEVHRFVAKHRDSLSPLSVREALKHIGEPK